jgi:hypothetical protein
MGLLDEFYAPDYSRLKRGQFRQDTPKMREYAANVPVDLGRGTVAGLLGLLSDTLNFAPAYSPKPMEQFGDFDYAPSQKVPFGSEEFLKTLPLAPAADNPVGRAAGQIGTFAPMVPVQAARLAGRGAAELGKFVAPKAGQLAENYMQRMGMMPSIVPVEGAGLLGDAAAVAKTPNVNEAQVSGLLSPAIPVKPMAEVSPLGFYSAVEQQALNIPRKSGTGASFINDLMKGQDVKKYEIEAMGLDEFLKGKPNVTRQEVQDFIAGNRIDVKEKILGGNEAPSQDLLSWMSSRNIMTPRNPQGWQELSQKLESYAQQHQKAQGAPEASQRYFTLSEEAGRISEGLDAGGSAAGATKYQKYQLPDGDNYREILLTTPIQGKAELDVAQQAAGDLRRQTADLMDQWKAASELNPGDPSVVGLYQKVADSRRLRDQAEATAQELKDQIGSQTYQSSHFDEPNILAHMRVNDRIDADGKKMLLIEEVQSDWHQAGREKGYISNYAKQDVKPYTTEQAKAEFGPANADLFWYFDVPGNKLQIPKSRFGTQDEAMNYVMTEKKVNPEGVPDAPFKDTWYQLALKRAIKEAVDKGYDRIGLTTGAQQAERFNLSKTVDQIMASKEGDGLRIFARDKEGKNHDMGIYAPNQLTNVVGKELAEKISNQVKPTDIYQGVDLKVGGEGMKKYYDEIYPAFLEKQGKKYGAKMGETRIKTGRGVPGGEAVRYLDITPEMRKEVKKGLPLAAAENITTGLLA